MQHVEFSNILKPVQAKVYYFLHTIEWLLKCRVCRMCWYSKIHFISFVSSLVSHLFQWRTKKQLTTFKLSLEVEYRALTTTTCELQWRLNHMNDLHVKCTRTLVIYCNNQNALHIVANHVLFTRINHLKINCHIVSEKQSKGIVKFLSFKSKDQLTDLFSKTLYP